MLSVNLATLILKLSSLLYLVSESLSSTTYSHVLSQNLSLGLSQTGQRKPEKHCYPNELAKELVIYEKWSIGVELALAVNLALVVALVVYMLCSKKGCDLSCLPNYCRDSLEWQSQQFENAQQGNYRLLVSQPNVHDAPQHVNTEVER